MTHPTLDVNHWDDHVTDPTIIVTDGHHVKIYVRDGHLVIEDGVPSQPRKRRIPRFSDVTRLVQLGYDGYITWEAYRWMSESQMTLTQVRNVPRYHDWRAIIGQVHGSDIAIRYLMRSKIQGQAKNLDLLGFPEQAERVLAKVKMLDNPADVMNAENGAARVYWNTWTKAVAVPWSPADAKKVPEHWKRFQDREGLYGHAKATDPVNAMLNLGYWSGEQACYQACVATGMNPVLGLVHAPRDGRDSFALDLLEAVRPTVDAMLIRYLRSLRSFNRDWCHEVRRGMGWCELDPPLTHTIGGWTGELFDAALPVAIEVARILRKERS